MRADEEGNMSEKMTDEELNRALRDVAGAGLLDVAGWFRAHIAALTAERDGLKVQLDGAEERGRMIFDAKNKMLDALRERVQALEADLEDKRALANMWMQSAQRLHGSLAAIRHRAGDEKRLGQECNAGATGDPIWATLHPVERKRWVDGAGAVARYILGDDAPLNPGAGGGEDTSGCCYQRAGGCEAHRKTAAPPEAFAHEKGLDAGVFRAEDEDPPLILPTTTARAAPTTPEAFATVRKGREWWAESAGDAPAGVEARRDLTLLALLERRMGAQEAAIRAVLATKGANTLESIDAWNALRASITGAPPVFTLEEAVNAVRSYTGSETTVDDVRRALTALRKTSP